MSRSEIIDILERMGIDRWTEVWDTDNEWKLLIKRGAPEDQHGPTYTIETWQETPESQIMMVARAGIRDEYRERLQELPRQETLMVQWRISQMATTQGMSGIPETQRGTECEIEFAEMYSFYLSFFSEDLTPSMWADYMTRLINTVNDTWTLLNTKT